MSDAWHQTRPKKTPWLTTERTSGPTSATSPEPVTSGCIAARGDARGRALGARSGREGRLEQDWSKRERLSGQVRCLAPDTAPPDSSAGPLVELVGLARQRREAGLQVVVDSGRRQRPRQQPAEARRERTCVTASPAAAHVPTQRLHVRSSPIAWWISPLSTGSSSPSSCPRTHGSRRKLVTSSPESVLAALNERPRAPSGRGRSGTADRVPSLVPPRRRRRGRPRRRP